MKRILLTGSAGFIFSNFIRKAIEDYGDKYKFVSIDKLVAEHNIANIYHHNNHTFYTNDIADPHAVNCIFNIERPDIVIHGAAESFVDDAIQNALPFVHSNVLGTQVLVDAAVKYDVKKFLYVSTDEVYGQLRHGDKSWTEEFPISPRNPYSASKAAGELIIKAANQTHNLQYIITRCCNNFGPRQPPRNLVPKIITSILNKQNIPIHGSGLNMREWLFVDDHYHAIMMLICDGKMNEIYNIGSGMELSNLEMVSTISKVLNKKSEISFIKDRLGHDFRYSVDCSKLKELGWKSSCNFDEAINKCVNWYVNNT